jgi:hypothetical protein
MPELFCKSPDGKVCVLKVEDGRVTLSYEKGLVGKSLVKTEEVALGQTIDAATETGVKPYRDSARLTIGYVKDGGERELTVFSRSVEKAEELIALVLGDIQRRRDALERARAEHKGTREAQLNRLQLDMELAENLFMVAEALHNRPDWGRVNELLGQVARVEEERESLAEPVRFSLDGLRGHVAARHPEEIKAELWRVLDTLYRGVHEYSKHSGKWFDRRACILLLGALYRMWDIRLGSVLGGGVWEMDDGLSQALDEVIERVSRETGRVLERPTGFDSVRHLLYEAVELLLGVELKVGITDVDELQ